MKKYLFIGYESMILGEKAKYGIFEIYESLFSHTISGEQALVLWIISNTTKSFRLEVTKEINVDISKIYKKYIECGNKIVSDGWGGYTFYQVKPDYLWDVQGSDDFDFWVNSNSFIESLWKEIKSKINHNHYIIPSKNFVSF